MRKQRKQLNAKEVQAIMIFLIVIFYIIGFGLLIYGGYTLYNKKQNSNYVKTEAVYIRNTFDQEAYERSLEESHVTKNSDKKKQSPSELYFITYMYIVNETPYEITTDYSTAFVPKDGARVKVLYNLDNPSEAYISSFWSDYGIIIFGMFFIIIISIIFRGYLPFMKFFHDMNKETKKMNKEIKKKEKENTSPVSKRPYI